jgi:hypothetical protein
VAVRGESQVAVADGQSQTVVVEDAGTVLLGRTGNALRIIAATPNAGWTSEVEVASGREVEGDFRSGEIRVKYNFELEDGSIRSRIEVGDDDRDDDDADDERTNGDVDDEGRDHGNSGPGSGDDDDDDNSNSGPGSGDDDRDEDGDDDEDGDEDD